MIDFSNAAFIKLTPVHDMIFSHQIAPLLIPGEEIVATYQAIRDGVVFTNKRIIAINVQGITGRKVDMTSLPYSRIQAFSWETAGTIDLDSEIDLWFNGVGKVRFEFASMADISGLCRMISEKVL